MSEDFARIERRLRVVAPKIQTIIDEWLSGRAGRSAPGGVERLLLDAADALKATGESHEKAQAKRKSKARV